MAEKHGSFIASSLTLLFLAFGVAFFISLFGIGNSGVLFKYALRWELLSALLILAAWTPAILLVSSALVTEGLDSSNGFTSVATRSLVPALVMAFVLSIFHLLLVPGIAERKSWYEATSALFEDTLKAAMRLHQSGELQEADRLLVAIRAIAPDEPRYSRLNDQIKQALVDSHIIPDLSPGTAVDNDADLLFSANRFYLEALAEMEAGRYIEAHYLAKRSAALHPDRVEVRRLVEESWRSMQETGPTPEEKTARSFHERKLVAYSSFAEGDFLTAYRIFNELYAENPDDLDVSNYLDRSAAGLESIAFFLEEDSRAFSRSLERNFSITYAIPNGEFRLQATGTAVSPDGIYFRDLKLARTGPEALSLKTPYARLKGTNLILRAVDHAYPYKVHEAVYSLGGSNPVTRHVISMPFDESKALMAFRMMGHPTDIPLPVLATGIRQAALFGLPTTPLMIELAMRSAYPFSTVILVLIGVALGYRFRPEQPLGTLRTLMGAPLMVALALVPIELASRVGRFMAEALAFYIPGQLYLPAWLGFLGLCTALSLFLSAHIASHAR